MLEQRACKSCPGWRVLKRLLKPATLLLLLLDLLLSLLKFSAGSVAAWSCCCPGLAQVHTFLYDCCLLHMLLL